MKNVKFKGSEEEMNTYSGYAYTVQKSCMYIVTRVMVVNYKGSPKTGHRKVGRSICA